MARVDVQTAQGMLFDDLMALHHDAQRVAARGDDGERRPAAGRFLSEVRRGHDEGRLVSTVHRLMRESRYGAVLDDPRRQELLLEQRIVLAPKPYSFLWSQAMLDLARRRVRRLGGR